jgi:hypothetical protein
MGNLPAEKFQINKEIINVAKRLAEGTGTGEEQVEKLRKAFEKCILSDGGYRGESLSNYLFCFLTADATGISKYLSTSRRLPDISARSQIIIKATEEATQKIKSKVGSEQLMFECSGSFLCLLPEKGSQQLVKDVKTAFEKKTHGQVRLDVALTLASGDEIVSSFGDVWQRCRRNLKKAKLESSLKLPTSIPVDREICDVCGLAPKAYDDPNKTVLVNGVERNERLCKTCFELRNSGRKIELDDLSRDSGYISAVKVDGDNFGKLLSGETGGKFTLGKLISLSEQIADIMKKLAENHLKRDKAEYLYAGGDDIMFFAPAEDGLKLASELNKAFQQEAKKFDTKLTLSAGAVFFKPKSPVSNVINSVLSLLKLAKGSGRNRIAYKYNQTHVETWSELDETLKLLEYLQSSGIQKVQLFAIAKAADRSPRFAEVIVKNRVGRGILKDETLLNHLDNFLKAYELYVMLGGKGPE